MSAALARVFDLHAHSTYSDGAYSPRGLIERAVAAGIHVLALTDHDTMAGHLEAEEAARELGVGFLPGVEISVTWQGKTLHLVGLRVDAGHPPLRAGLEGLALHRQQRAFEMAQRLEKVGVIGIYDEVLSLAGQGMVTRTHFAHCLARRGLAADVRDVFNRYLTPGKPGYVHSTWAGLETAIAWIRGAGGVAVLAHPIRYKLTGSWLRRLALEFKEFGGQAIEVLSGQASPGDVQASAQLAKRFDLLGSCGSDFHGPDQGWPKLGRLPPMPKDVTPVWSLWPDAEALGSTFPPAAF